MHRKIETVAEEQLRPFPPGAELLDPAQQIVTVDQGRRHVRCHRAEHQTRLDDTIEFANGRRNTLLSDMAKAGLEHEIEFAVLERQIDDRSELVELFQLLWSLGVDRAVVLDAPGIDPLRPQRAD